MKMLILENDRTLANNIVRHLNTTRITFEAKIIQNEKEIYEDISFLEDCSIFILNLKNPLDISIMRFIRESGNDSPILLILENNIEPCMFKLIYYLSYNDIVVKDFMPEEITFRVYKLCNLWNDNVFFLDPKIYYDFKKAIFFYYDEKIHLGRKEALLLKLLFIKSPCIVSYDEIIYYVYQNEIIPQERIRSIIREIRNKLPINLIETKKGEGYKLVEKHKV